MSEVHVPVAVCARVRPFSASEVSDGSSNCVTCTSHDQLKLTNGRAFRFDRVFPPTSNQVDIYYECVRPLVLKCLQGINCTIFAYGQTGSGKTYTLGSGGQSLYEGGGATDGIIPRTLQDLFGYLKEGVVTDGGVADEREACQLSVSYVEVYKEEIRDLLSDNECDINIREDESGRTVLSGVVEEEISSVDEALNLLETGNAVRVTMATEMNVHSSRSHVAFIVTIIQDKRVSLPVLTDKERGGGGGGGRDVDSAAAVINEEATLFNRIISKFTFVDLAGSERVNRTHNTGERFKESVHINGGLLALGNVINALTEHNRKSSHVPYRDSKITRLLKDSLGGHAHTLMITCLSPCEKDLPETLNTLKYAKRARNIKNHPIVNVDPQVATVMAMRDEIETLKTRLQHADSAVFKDDAISPVEGGASDSLKEEIEKYKSDLLANEELFAVKEKELSDLRSECDRLIVQNNQLEMIIREMERKEEELTNKVLLLEKQLHEIQRDRVTTSTAAVSENSQSHDGDWINRTYAAVNGKINMSFLKNDVSNESCDRMLHHMMSLLDDDDVISQSCDNHVTDSLVQANESVIASQKRLQSMEKWFVQEQQKIRSLNLKIKLKEELITELIKNNKSIRSLNDAYQRKISSLETEACHLKKKIKKISTTGSDCRLEPGAMGHSTDEDQEQLSKGTDDLKQELEIKLKQTETKLATLQKRRQETLRLLQTGEKSERKIAELEGELERLRNKQAQLKKKVKEEGERKRELEKEMERYQKEVSKLTQLTVQQGHVLKVKTEEVAMAQRKLREIKRPKTETSAAESKSVYTNNKWLEDEVQKISEKKEQLEKLQKDLKERETLVRQHELMLKERTLLQEKRRQAELRSSQSILHLSDQLESLSRQIKGKQNFKDSLEECSVSEGEGLQNEIESLTDKHHCILEKKRFLEDQLSEGRVLNQEEEMRIVELQEQIEVLETSLQLKMSSLQTRISSSSSSDQQHNLLPYQSDEDHLKCKVNGLSQSEAQSLLIQSVLRISSLEEALKEKEREGETVCSLLDEERGNVEKLKQSLTQLQMDKQRRMTQSEKEHVKQVNTLIRHMTESVQSVEPVTTAAVDEEKEEVTRLKKKIKGLEKDLYFYKKTSRDLKQKLKIK